MVTAGIIGVDEVVAKIKAKRKNLGYYVEKGMRKAGATLLAASQKMVPVEYGQLRASGFQRTIGRDYKARVIIGYTATYAFYVHELVGMKLKGKPRISGIGRYWDPRGARAKFLERPARDLAPKLRQIIRDEARKGLRD